MSWLRERWIRYRLFMKTGKLENKLCVHDGTEPKCFACSVQDSGW